MIPALDYRGLLPEGIHECTLTEACDWKGNDVRRGKIWSGLEIVLVELRNLVVQSEQMPGIILAGSYFSDKPNPGDIEITVMLKTAHPLTTGKFILAYIAKQYIWKSEHEVDFHPTIDALGANDFGAFFQYVGTKTAALKGINPSDKRGVVKVNQW